MYNISLVNTYSHSDDATTFRSELFNPRACFIRAMKTTTEWWIWICMSVNIISRGPPPPPLLLFTWWGGIPFLLRLSNLILMGLSITLQQRAVLFCGIGLVNYYGSMRHAMYHLHPCGRSPCTERWAQSSSPSWNPSADHWRWQQNRYSSAGGVH